MSIKMVTGANEIQGEAGKEGSEGKIVHLYKYMQARSFSMVPSDKARGSGYKLKLNAGNTIECKKTNTFSL